MTNGILVSDSVVDTFGCIIARAYSARHTWWFSRHTERAALALALALALVCVQIRWWTDVFSFRCIIFICILIIDGFFVSSSIYFILQHMTVKKLDAIAL